MRCGRASARMRAWTWAEIGSPPLSAAIWPALAEVSDALISVGSLLVPGPLFTAGPSLITMGFRPRVTHPPTAGRAAFRRRIGYKQSDPRDSKGGTRGQIRG